MNTTADAAGEARIAGEVARALRPRTVLDASGAEMFAGELRRNGIHVVAVNGAPLSPSARFDLIACVPGPLAFSFDMLAQVERYSERVLFVPPSEGKTPLTAWLTGFSSYGYAPDPDFEPGAIGSAAVLFQRAPVWPPDALRVFAGWMQMRNPGERLSTLEAEVAEQRRLTSLFIASRSYNGSGVSEAPAPPPPPDLQPIVSRIEALERALADLARSHQAVNARLEEMLNSRTWRALTTIGAIPLRLLGRAS